MTAEAGAENLLRLIGTWLVFHPNLELKQSAEYRKVSEGSPI